MGYLIHLILPFRRTVSTRSLRQWLLKFVTGV